MADNIVDGAMKYLDIIIPFAAVLIFAVWQLWTLRKPPK